MTHTLRCVLCVCACLWVGAVRADAPRDSDPDDDSPLTQQESRNVRPRLYEAGGGGNALPSGFRAPGGLSLAELAGYQRAPPGPARGPPRPAPAPAPLEEEEEREEPDRLAALLQQSKFECAGRPSGYYADQELACEVFHYCQDTVKHSWICPDGFTFHQVHLICMPPTHDNICQKSSKYTFVNEYLYRPINEEEVQRKPNVSLRYSDRYYPAEVYRDDRYEDDDDGGDAQDERRYGPAPAPAAPAPARPATVFRSAEDVDISLTQRRPVAPPRPYHFAF